MIISDNWRCLFFFSFHFCWQVTSKTQTHPSYFPWLTELIINKQAYHLALSSLHSLSKDRSSGRVGTSL